jgi:hypothetical protein
MNRRHFHLHTAQHLGLLTLLTWQQAHALSLGDLSASDASGGLKTALEKATQAAVESLGKAGGFMANEKVRIALPGYLNDGAKLLRTLGQGKRVDELVSAMNQGAEQAVPQGRQLLTQSVQQMTVTDAKAILSGGDTSVTKFFSEKTRPGLSQTFLPIVTQATDKVGLADKYNKVAAKASGMGLVKAEDANIQKYVTGKTLDGLYLVIGEEEKKIRQNPEAYGSALLTKVFGALK